MDLAFRLIDMTILLVLFAKYLLLGCPISFLLERVVVTFDPEMEFTLGEKALCIVLWPFMTLIFGFYFCKGLMEE